VRNTDFRAKLVAVHPDGKAFSRARSNSTRLLSAGPAQEGKGLDETRRGQRGCHSTWKRPAITLHSDIALGWKSPAVTSLVSIEYSQT